MSPGGPTRSIRRRLRNPLSSATALSPSSSPSSLRPSARHVHLGVLEGWEGGRGKPILARTPAPSPTTRVRSTPRGGGSGKARKRKKKVEGGKQSSPLSLSVRWYSCGIVRCMSSTVRLLADRGDEVRFHAPFPPSHHLFFIRLRRDTRWEGGRAGAAVSSAGSARNNCYFVSEG